MHRINLFAAGAAGALALAGAVHAQVVTGGGCYLGVACQAKSLALGGATPGANALAVTGTVNLSSTLTVGGAFTLPYNTALNILDSGATSRRAILQSGGSYLFGDIDSAISGSNAKLYANNAVQFVIAGSQAGYVNASATSLPSPTFNSGANSFTITPGTSNLATFNGSVSAANLYATAANQIGWLASTTLTAPTNGQLQVANSTASSSFTVTASGGGVATFGGTVSAGSSLYAGGGNQIGWNNRNFRAHHRVHSDGSVYLGCRNCFADGVCQAASRSDALHWHRASGACRNAFVDCTVICISVAGI